MGLESATYISDLDASNPLSTDKKKQGDDHLRLIKSVLKTTIPNADRPWRMPEFATKTTTANIATTDENKTILADTSGGTYTLTLPTPAFDGWMVRVMKSTTDANAVFVAPPSGNISTNVGAVAKIRIGVPFRECIFVWTGSAFIEFDGMEEPGVALDYFAATAPVGYAFIYGQTLSGTSADYPQLYARRATLVMPDARGRTTFGKDDMGGAAANRLSGIDGATLGAAGGSELLLQTNLPNVNFTVTIPAGQGSHTHTEEGFYPTASENPSSVGGLNFTGAEQPQSTGPATLPEMSGTAASGGSGTAFLPPGIVCNKIMRIC